MILKFFIIVIINTNDNYSISTVRIRTGAVKKRSAQ